MTRRDGRQRRARAGWPSLALSALVFALPQASPPPSPEPVTNPRTVFTIGVLDEVYSFNPIWMMYSPVGSFVYSLLYSDLVRYDSDGSIVPDLAQDWSQSDDGLSWTFHLREDATWSDGTPITAGDVAWSANHWLEERPYGRSDRIYEGVRRVFAPDKWTVVWEMEVPDASVPTPSTFDPRLIVPEHVWSTFGKDDDRYEGYPAPIVSGPYGLTSWTKGTGWSLTARDDYWGEAQRIDEIRFLVFDSEPGLEHALATGKIDYARFRQTGSLRQIEDVPGISTRSSVGNATEELRFRSGRDPEGNEGPLADRDLRVALGLAVDRSDLVADAMDGLAVPGSSIIPPSDPSFWEPPGIPESAEPGPAARMLDDAGYLDRTGDGLREGRTGEPLQLSFLVDAGSTPEVRAAAAIVRSFEGVGIDVALDPRVGRAFSVPFYQRDFDMVLTETISPNERAAALGALDSRSYIAKQMGYSVEAYDSMLDRLARTSDPQIREELGQDLQAMVAQHAPLLVLWYADVLEAWRSDRWTMPTADGVAVMGGDYDEGNPGWVFSIRERIAAPSPGSFPLAAVAATVVALTVVLGVAARRRRHEVSDG